MASETVDPLCASAYRSAGVNIRAGNQMVSLIAPFVRATWRPGVCGTIGGFGGIFDLKATNFRDPLLVATTDGVGTKLKIAADGYAPQSVGTDLVAMCVNDLLVHGAEPLFFLDYYATGLLNPALGASIVENIAAACVEAGCALIGGETAEMPGMYDHGEYDLAGFAVGAVEREDLLPKSNVSEGDVILGLASSGVHANGFSLVRKIMADHGFLGNHPAPFAPSHTLHELFLTPTRIYVKLLLPLLRGQFGIKALAHITGGGLTDNIPRVLPESLAARIDVSNLRVPPVFSWISQIGSVSQEEMFHTFNCGVGMVLIVEPQYVEEVCRHLQLYDENCMRLGTIVPASGSQIIYDGRCF